MSDTTLTLSISGNTTLTNAQAANGGYVFSGTLTGTAIVTWPSFMGFAAITNSIAGGFTISCGILGGEFVDILNGQSAAVWSDGTNFIRLAPSVTSPTFINGTYNPNNTLAIGGGSAPNEAGISLTLLFQRGTAASPSATQYGDEIGFVQCFGFDGSDFTQAVPNAWVFIATENWTTTAHGCVTVIQATPNQSTTGQDEISIGNGLTAVTSNLGQQGLESVREH